MAEKEGRFDYIIAGGGSAGCILAARLAEDSGVKVLLLERGGWDDHWTVRMPGAIRSHYKLESKFNYHLETVPQRHLDGRKLYQPRGKVLGGSGSINGMVYLRGHPLDYARWVQEGCEGWAFAECLPYFKRLESIDWAEGEEEARYRGDSGPVGVHRARDGELNPLNQAFLEAGRQAGFPLTGDVNGRQQEGFCLFDMNVDGGIRASSAYAYLHKRKRPENLTIHTGVICHQVIVDKGRALGLRYSRNGEVKEAHAEREVVLSAGAFGSPQLLMLSGIGPAEHLRGLGIEVRHDLPGVGANLQDHMEIHVQHRSRVAAGLNRYLAPHRMALLGMEWFLKKSGICARNQANVGAFLCSNDSAAHPNVQFHFFPVYFDGWTPRSDTHGYRLGSGTMRPLSRGEVRLASADPREAPLIDPNFLAEEQDRIEMREAFWLARETLAQEAFRPFDAGEDDPGPAVRSDAQVDAYIREKAGSAYHPAGSCKMGPQSDAMAVCDAQGRVHGLEGLRVVDASLMPSIASSNLNCVVMMMAEKLSDVIAGKAPLPAEDPPIVAKVS